MNRASLVPNKAFTRSNGFEYMEDRWQRTRELGSVLETGALKPEPPEILGGDFNAPAGDAIYKLLHNCHDSHRAAGRGWGNTALNPIPAFARSHLVETPQSCFILCSSHREFRPPHGCRRRGAGCKKVTTDKESNWEYVLYH